MFLGIDDKGWVKYTNITHNGAGPLKIINENRIRLSDKDVVSYLNSSNLTNMEFKWFMKKASKYFRMI